MARCMKMFAALLLMCAGLSSAAADDMSPATGVWVGTGVQGEHTWSMRVTFAEDEVRIEYPSLECGGTWEPTTTNQASEDAVHFHERLEYGHHACIADGFVKLRITDSGIEYEWSRSSDDAVEATALLQRDPN